MDRLGKQLTSLYCLSGDTMNIPLAKALPALEYDDSCVKKRNKRVDDIHNGRKPDRIPVSGDIRWWFAEQYNDGTLAEKLSGVNIGKIMATGWISKYFQPSKESDPIPGISVREEWSGEPIVYVNGGFPGTEHAIIVETKAGSVRAVEAYASRSYGIIEHPVKTIDDLRIVRHIYELRAKHARTDVDPARLMGPLTPIQNFLIHLAGVEPGVLMLLDNKDEVESFMSFLTEIERPLFELLASKRKMVFSCENLASDVSAPYWDDYLGPQLKDRARICASHGGKYGIHHDGRIKPLFARLREADIAYVNGVTAAPSGDVEPELLREMAGPDMIIADIIPQTIFTDAYSDKAFDEYIARVAAYYKNDGKIILGIGDMLPATADIRRMERYYDIVEGT